MPVAVTALLLPALPPSLALQLFVPPPLALAVALAAAAPVLVAVVFDACVQLELEVPE